MFNKLVILLNDVTLNVIVDLDLSNVVDDAVQIFL